MDKNKLNLINLVRKEYSAIAQGQPGCVPMSCCVTGDNALSLSDVGNLLGYSKEELSTGLGEANLGLGCGNPQAIAELKEGEVVLDLGSGAGFDAFLAGMKVGPHGRVIGIDMTPEMISRARKNAIELKAENVEFRLGEIEYLPVADSTVDVIISNCVINLSVDKQAVFYEAYRVLKLGGRLALSDILKKKEVSKKVQKDPSAYTG